MKPGSVLAFATALLSLLAVVGCSTVPDANDEPREERIYRTGSNLPAKDYGSVRTIDAETLRDSVRKADQPRHGR
jgi:hypothetical protein